MRAAASGRPPFVGSYSAVAAVGAAVLFTGAFADVFTGVFTDAFIVVFTDVFIVVFTDVFVHVVYPQGPFLPNIS